MNPPRLAVIVPVLNERRRLPAVLAGIEAQTLPPQEVIIVDGNSDDGSREWLLEAAATRPWLRVIDNPDKIISAALNRAVAVTGARFVARMDAHADYDPDYLAVVVGVLEAHPEVAAVGGAMSTGGKGRWGGAIASVLRSRWSLGGAGHRVGGAAGPINHAFCCAYRRSAIINAGGWDLGLLANEDVEMDYRIGRREGLIWLDPMARSIWYTRTGPRALSHQMWRYGNFRARTMHLHRDTLRLRHLAPPALLVGLTSLILLNRRLGLVASTIYLGFAGSLGAACARADKASTWRAAIALPLVHTSWGGGLLFGLWQHRGARPRLQLEDLLTSANDGASLSKDVLVRQAQAASSTGDDRR